MERATVPFTVYNDHNPDVARIQKLEAALREMLEAHSFANIGIGASRRRLFAIEKARAALKE